MRIILLCVFILAGSAQAQQTETFIPDGCYVADEYRTDPCYEPGPTYIQWYTPGAMSIEELGFKYGQIVTSLIQYGYLRETGANIEARMCKVSTRENLIKRLRKACGKKCKRIK